MKKILIVSFTNLATDPRVNRQIRFLSENNQVIAVGLANPNIANVDFIPLTPTQKQLAQKSISGLQLITRQYESYYWSQQIVLECLEKLSHIQVDLIIANDIITLPLALKIAKSAKVIFDAHEYAPLEFEDKLSFRLFFQNYYTYLCQKYIPSVNAMMTVCQSIADTYEKDTGIVPVVVTNAPHYEEIQPRLYNDNSKTIRLIHHGGATTSRKIETMIKMMDYLDERFELILMLVQSSKGYLQYLKNIAKDKQNIQFRQPVKMLELAIELNKYDIGIYILEPNNFNNKYALPNKFFEFIQARLGIAIAPSPEMAKIVKEYDLGVVADDFSPQALAHSLMQLDHQKINFYKQQSHKIAHLMSAQNNKKILLNLVEHVLKQ
ncbi:MAG: hypothetical protein ACIWVG_24940 [Gloeotrichia echinulata HAB0833]